MARKVLGISWLHGRFQAVIVSGGGVSGSWTSPEPVLNDADFGPALAEAVKQTRFTGTHVQVVLDHRSLLFHVQETPPARGKQLRQLLGRQVTQNRFFEEPAAWGYIALPALKERHRFLLALLPESLLRELAAACAAQRLQLTGVLPLAAVLGDQLRQLPARADEIVVLAADLGASLHLLLGRGDGQVLFSRSVVLSSAQQSDRAAQEVNRTLHYAQQQFGADVSQLFVIGGQAFAVLKDMQVRQGLKIQQSPVAVDPISYAHQAAAASPKLTLNLVSRAESRQRHARQLLAAGLAALLIASAATVFKVERTVRARERQATAAVQQLEAAANALTAAQIQQRDARRSTALLALVGTTNTPPVPELFARYLATAIPDSMRLNQLAVVRNTNGWSFHVEGFAREQTGTYLGLLERFEQELRTSVFHARIDDSTHRRLFGGTDAGPVAAPPVSGARADEKVFFVNGVIE
jgi:hypothetical protein